MLARLPGPPVATCFTCDEVIPLQFVSWHSEMSAQGRVVALLPYCERCVPERERRQAVQRLERDIQRVEIEGTFEAQAA